MAKSRVQTRLDRSIQDALEEIRKLAKKNILNAFDSEYGYTESGSRVSWDSLDEEYVKRYRGGNSTPILNITETLRKSIEVKPTKNGFESGVFSQSGHPTPSWGKNGQTRSIKQVSQFNSNRPHTNPSKKYLGDSAFIRGIFSKHFNRAVRELQKEGLL